uniref:Protein phosphatase 1 regulatory inhibitor subunit 14A n=1 Tax=Anas platyrhynchos TaxID=8839 RepID=A0A8B9QWU5_ANAPL
MAIRGGPSHPARPRPPRLSPGPPPRRQARVTVRYDRRQLQRRLDTERWIDGRLGELYRGREVEMPDEVNIDDLLELPTDEERAQRLQVWGFFFWEGALMGHPPSVVLRCRLCAPPAPPPGSSCGHIWTGCAPPPRPPPRRLPTAPRAPGTAWGWGRGGGRGGDSSQ